MSKDAVLGIDIAKAKCDVALLRADGKIRRKSCPNAPKGFAELTQWLERHEAPRVHAALEATGTYGDALADYLYDAGHASGPRLKPSSQQIRDHLDQHPGLRDQRDPHTLDAQHGRSVSLWLVCAGCARFLLEQVVEGPFRAAA